MAAKTTLNARNLEALGVQRLAELLIEISMGSAANKRKLRLELAGSQSSGEVAREVRKRFASIARARTFIDWRKVKALKADLETQRSTIVNTIAPDDPGEALDLLWQFLGLAGSIFERSDDGSGTLIESFHQARDDAGLVAQSARIKPVALADKVFDVMKVNDYGQYDSLIRAMSPALGESGLAHLRTLFTDLLNEPIETIDPKDRRVIGWGSNGPMYEHEVYGRHNQRMAQTALQEIADLQGDVDAYIAQQPEQSRKSSIIAADIATRLLSAGRAAEALAALDNADTVGRDPPFEWQQARVEALEALNRREEAQAYRWQCFEQDLSDEHLTAFLRRLPDFDDIEAEEKAFAFARRFPDIYRALSFFILRPAIGEAARLVLDRRDEFDGDLYEVLTPAAEILADKYPLAATIVLRSMIDFSLERARSNRYKHTARHLVECEALASRIEDFGKVPSHVAYVADLQRRHGKKHGFWGLVR